MLTQAHINEIRRQTGVSTVDAMHALAVANGDVPRAIDDLHDHARAGNRSVVVSTKDGAQRIAAALIDSGIWFECEVTPDAHWRFSVALGAYARLLALSAATNAEAQPA